MIDTESKYSYCPYCVEELTKCGKNYKEVLRPLYVVTDCLYVPEKDGSFRKIVDTHYECTRCGNTNITVKSFMAKYCEKASVSESLMPV